MFVLVKMTGMFFPKSRGRNLEVKEGPDSYWKPKLRGTKIEYFFISCSLSGFEELS